MGRHVNHLSGLKLTSRYSNAERCQGTKCLLQKVCISLLKTYSSERYRRELNEIILRPDVLNVTGLLSFIYVFTR